MGEPSDRETPDDQKGIVARVAAVVTILFMFNTAWQGVLQGAAQRRTTYRAVSKSEEDHWASLYREYFAALDSSNDDARERKLLAIYQLSQRKVSSFSDLPLGYTIGRYTFFDSGGGDRGEARQNIVRMRDNLLGLLASKPTSTKEVVSNSIYDRDAAVESARKSDQGTITAAEQAATVAAVTQEPDVPFSYDIKTLAAGVSNGWDIDIFWCAGEGERGRFASALKVGQSVAALSNARGSLGPGMPLGRVRLRVLPITRQTAQQPSNRNYIAFDTGRGDKELAEALTRRVGTMVTPGFTLFASQGALTRWYVSAFVCGSQDSG